MPSEPLPQLIVTPCGKCGEEAIVQLILTYNVSNEIQITRTLKQQCGCVSAG